MKINENENVNGDNKKKLEYYTNDEAEKVEGVNGMMLNMTVLETNSGHFSIEVDAEVSDSEDRINVDVVSNFKDRISFDVSNDGYRLGDVRIVNESRLKGRISRSK